MAGLVGIVMPPTTSAHAASFAPANLPATNPPTNHPTNPAAGPTDGRSAEALIIGDSVLNALETSVGARATLTARHPFTIDAKVCRRLIARSCAYQGSTPTTALDVLQADPGSYPTLVIGAGYNDGSIATAIDTFIGEARHRGIAHVAWITYHAAGPLSPTFAAHNAILRDKLAVYPELSIIDWNTQADRHPEWTGTDGLHLTPAGTQAMASLIGDALDRLAGSPGPVARCPAAAPSEQPVEAPIPTTAPALPDALGMFALPAPVRLLDTRRLASVVKSHGVVAIPVAGRSGIPGEAVGVVVTVTAVDSCSETYLTAFPCGTIRPDTSIVNAPAGSTVANSAVIGLGTGGALCVYADAATDVLVDASGWLAPGGEGLVALPVPMRLIDTRPGSRHVLPDNRRLAAGDTLAVDAGRVDEVRGSGLLAVNVTAVGPAGAGYLTVFPGPCDGTRPEASNLNTTAGHDVAAGAIVANPVGGPGVMCVYSSVATDVIVDLQAVARAGLSKLETVVPFRAVDTRRTTAIAAGQELAVTVVGPSPEGGAATSSRFGIIGTLTAVGPLGDGYLTMYPCGTVVPDVSNLNVHRGDIVANMVTTGFGDNGRVCIFSSVTTDVLFDVAVWLISDNPLPA